MFSYMLQTATNLKAGVHLRAESEINVERIFKERVHLRELYDSRELLTYKSQRKISGVCPLNLIKKFTESILQRAKFVLDVLGTNMEQQESAALCVMYHILKKRRNKKRKCWVKNGYSVDSGTSTF